MKAALLTLLLAGCATITQDEATAGMRGWTRAEVLACAGAPYREAADGSMTVMSYSTFTAVEGIARQCDVTFALQDGRVSSVKYSGRDRTCQAVLRNCIRK